MRAKVFAKVCTRQCTTPHPEVGPKGLQARRIRTLTVTDVVGGERDDLDSLVRGPKRNRDAARPPRIDPPAKDGVLRPALTHRNDRFEPGRVWRNIVIGKDHDVSEF